MNTVILWIMFGVGIGAVAVYANWEAIKAKFPGAPTSKRETHANPPKAA